MYTRYFGLTEKPFTITPDPRYLFMSTRHGEALAHLIYGVSESDGFIQLTGEVGTGKTTLIRSLFQQLPEKADIALILNPQLSAREFLASIASELGIESASESDSLKSLIDTLTDHLLTSHAAGRRTILVVDEAQLLTTEVLEQVRMLTNLETARQKLLQIILIGQPELRELLSRNDLRQLAQRITARYHLEPLTREETSSYIDHRLQVAGATGSIFTANAKREIFSQSKGIPRLINVICDRSLLGAYVREEPRVDKELVRQAAREIKGVSGSSGIDKRWLPWLGAAGVLAITATAIVLLRSGNSTNPDVSTASVGSIPAEQTVVTTLPDNRPPPPKLAGDNSVIAIEDLGVLLAQQRDQTGTDTAFRALFATWNRIYESGYGCPQAQQKYQLHCHYMRGSWNIVRQLNRPAILTLTDRAGESHQVVLTAIRGDAADIRIGDQVYTLNQNQISEYWFGESLLLWQPPNGVAKSYRQGMRDPGVLWVRNSLGVIAGTPVEKADSDLFDLDLERLVKDFQRGRRLKVDGLVGQQTQIIINSDLGLDGIPLLTRPTGD